MKKLVFIISICLILFTGLSEIKPIEMTSDEIAPVEIESVERDTILFNDDIDYFQNNEVKSIQLRSKYFDKLKNIESLVKVYDTSGNLQDINVRLSYQSIYIRGNFKRDQKYKLHIKADDMETNYYNVRYDYNRTFIFETGQIHINDINVSNELKKLKSAQIILYFNTGNIISKDIRNYIEFLNEDINYSFAIDYNRLLLYGDFKPNKKYEFKLKKGFESGISVISKDMYLETTFGDLKKNVNFTDYKSYVSSYTQAIDIETTNLNLLDIEILKINTENLNYLNLFKTHYLRDKYFQDNYHLNSYGEIVEKYKKAIAYEKNKTIKTQLNFNDKLKHKSDGIYLILIKDNKDKYINDSKLVFKSDLGISTKVAKNQMFFSIRSLASNDVIPNADILVYSTNNKLLFQGKSNYEGIYNKKFKNIVQSTPKLVIVKKDEQINFLNLEESISSYDILNDKSNIKNEYDALVFTERSLLRPSDKANMLITVKNKSFKSLENQIIYLQFIDPTQKELFTKELILNEAGTAQYQFTSFNDYKTGRYRINVLLGKEKIGYKEFNIEAFVPEKIEVKVESKKEKYLLNENIQFIIKSKYLFGTPAKGLKYDMEVMANKSSYNKEKFKEYSFENLLEKNNQLITANIQQNGELDENGNKEFDLSLNINKTSNSLIKTSLIGTVFDDGRAVRKFKEINIYPFKTIVGIKKDFKGTVETNKPVNFSTILINPLNDSKDVETKNLKVKVFKKFYHYYAGEEIREIENFEVNSSENIEITPKQSGSYYVLVETPDGQISSETFYASGWSYDSFNIKDKSSYKITIKTNKEVYKDNDVITIDLKSPISGKLLLTFEEDEILDYRVLNLDKNTAVLNIPMNDKIKKGAYIKAQVIRSTQTSDEIFPFRVVGSKYIKKDNSSKKLLVEIKSNELYKSGDDVTIKISSDIQEGYAVVSMVDSGILNIINEKPTDAFKYFDRKNKDNISLYDLYSNLQKINKLKSESVSGDGIEAKKEKHLSPDAINERVKPVSFWSGIIKLKNGLGETTFKLPNFNGEVLIQSLIVNDEKIGSSSKKVIVKDDVVIKPTLPRFLIKNDDVIIPVRLLNTTDKVQDIALSIQTTSNLELTKNRISLKLNPQESKVIEVGIKALEEGPSKISLKASNKKDTFTNETSIYVKNNFDYKVVSKFGLVKPNESIDVNIVNEETKALNTKVEVYVGLDNSPFAKLNKSVKYLVSYPYGCSEQTSSKLLAMLMSKKFIDKDNTKLLNEREMFINQGINKLISLQRSDGLFTYWKGGTYVNEYASFYATYVLNILNEEGFNVPKNVLKSGLAASWKNFTKNYNDLNFFYVDADKSMTNMLYDRKYYGNNLTSFVSLAAAMKKHGNIKEYKKLIYEAKKYFETYNMNASRKYSYSFYSPIKDVAASLYIYIKFINNDTDDEFTKNLFRTVSNYVNNDELYSTQDKAFAMMALDSYYKNIDISSTNINASIKYENELKNITSKTFQKIILKEKNNILITNDGGVINYVIDINKPIKLSVNSNQIDTFKNIYLQTEIIDLNGFQINHDNINLGDKLFMKATVMSHKKIENVAANIQIPSGLEIINPRLYKSNNMKFKNVNYSPDYEDYRDDRVVTFLTTNEDKKIFYIPLIATTKGTFTYPASYIEAMYDSRLNAYHKPVKTITIK